MMHNFSLRHLAVAVVALCPLSMIVMMLAMGHQDGGSHAHADRQDHSGTRP